MLERALGVATTFDPNRQAATEETLDAWLVEDESVLRAHAIAMELPSGRIVAVAGTRVRDADRGRTLAAGNASVGAG